MGNTQTTVKPPQPPYERLGIAPTASVSEINAAFRRLSLLHHPDKAPPETRAEATKAFQELSNARDACIMAATGSAPVWPVANDPFGNIFGQYIMDPDVWEPVDKTENEFYDDEWDEWDELDDFEVKTRTKGRKRNFR